MHSEAKSATIVRGSMHETMHRAVADPATSGVCWIERWFAFWTDRAVFRRQRTAPSDLIPLGTTVYMSQTTARRRRSYSRSGLYGGQRAAPAVVARASDPAVPDDALTDLERGCRNLRDELVDALGGLGEISPQQRILVDVIVSRALVVGSTQKYVAFELGGAIIDRRSHRVKRLAFDLAKLEDGLVRACQAIGLQRTPPSLAEFFARQTRQDAPCGALGDGDGQDVGAAAGAPQDAEARDVGAEGNEVP